jgi:hypothetical protein
MDTILSELKVLYCQTVPAFLNAKYLAAIIVIEYDLTNQAIGRQFPPEGHYDNAYAIWKAANKTRQFLNGKIKKETLLNYLADEKS